MSNMQMAITIAILAMGTFITRALPFFLFPENKPLPPMLLFLGKALPSAIIGMLIVYCLKDVSFAAAPHGLPEALAILFICLLHLWRKHTLLSIGGGTLFYMFLVQVVFI